MLADGNTELKLHLSSVDFKLDLKRRTAASDFTFEALVAFGPDRSTLEFVKCTFQSLVYMLDGYPSPLFFHNLASSFEAQLV